MNYNVMNGFDVFGAWIQANPLWIQDAPEPKKVEGANGKHEMEKEESVIGFRNR